jgi:hypothetical protein
MEAILFALKFAATSTVFTLAMIVSTVLFILAFDVIRADLSTKTKWRALLAFCLVASITLTWCLSR